MTRGFFCGVFDLFHFGHILALRECKQHCTHLTVAINRGMNIDKQINPEKTPPIFPIEHRFAILEACRLVDEVLVYDSEKELLELLAKGKYDVRFLGEDYKGKQITGSELSTKIHFINRDHGYSTSLFKRKLEELSNKRRGN